MWWRYLYAPAVSWLQFIQALLANAPELSILSVGVACCTSILQAVAEQYVLFAVGAVVWVGL
jgi:hypothetical protein